MSDQKISTLLALSLIASPFAVSAGVDNSKKTVGIESASNRASLRRMKHLLASTPQLQAMGTYVGQLQERWQFPSDHLPIGLTVDDLHIASWNVLDSAYMSWVTEKDSQGLKRSMIADEHVYIGDSKLTLRDQHVATLILQMIAHPSHPKSLLSLQECSEPFLVELKSRLPSHFEIIAHDGNAIVVDRNRFEILNANAIAGVYSADPKRTFQDIVVRRLESQEKYRLLNVHIPGDPNGPARYDFTSYLSSTHDPSLTTIAMGDMNFNELEMSDAITKAFEQTPFTLYSPYCTNISVSTEPNPFTSKAIDHFIVSKSANVKLHQAEEVLIGLDSTARLLNPNFTSF